MKTFKITVNHHDMGDYQGNSEDEAILAYIKDAGYSSLDEAAEVLHLPVDNLGIRAIEQ